MKKANVMLILWLALNCAIVVPLTCLMLTKRAGTDRVVGADSDAWRMLAHLCFAVGGDSFLGAESDRMEPIQSDPHRDQADAAANPVQSLHHL